MIGKDFLLACFLFNKEWSRYYVSYKCLYIFECPQIMEFVLDVWGNKIVCNIWPWYSRGLYSILEAYVLVWIIKYYIQKYSTEIEASNWVKPGFFNTSTWFSSFLVVWSHPTYYRMFSSIPDLYLLNAKGTFSVVTAKNIYRY